MALFRCAAFLALVLSLPVALNLAHEARAVPTVWTGPTISFTKTGSDPTVTSDPLNQDRLTDNVWLTRGGDMGMFNIAPGKEDSYVRYTSPADTQWATSVMPANTGKTIAASNWAQLAFTDWAPSYGGPGSTLGANIPNHNAVVHLLTDDIYLDLSFSYFVSGGDFIYTRSTPAAAAPTGDYNHNNVVDAGDYVVWRSTLGDSASPFGGGADGNSNGTIDPGDYTYWRERYGNAPVGLGAGLASIPEPTIIPVALQLIAVVLCTFRWQRDRTPPTNRTTGRTATNTNLCNDPILVVGTNSPTNFNDQSGSIDLAVPEPAGGLLAVAKCCLFGLRLRVPTQGRLCATNFARKVENDNHASLEDSFAS